MAAGKGKRKNERGTTPRRTVDAPAPAPGRKSVKSGPARSTGPKHAAARASGQKTTATRKAGPKTTRARTTTRSGDK